MKEAGDGSIDLKLFHKAQSICRACNILDLSSLAVVSPYFSSQYILILEVFKHKEWPVQTLNRGWKSYRRSVKHKFFGFK